jgi:hypothetical protein
MADAKLRVVNIVFQVDFALHIAENSDEKEYPVFHMVFSPCTYTAMHLLPTESEVYIASIKYIFNIYPH